MSRRKARKKKNAIPRSWLWVGGVLLVAGLLWLTLPKDIAAPSPTVTATQATLPTSTHAVTTSPIESPASPIANAEPPTFGYRVVNVFPHDRGAFTQGLVFQDGIFYEGTGLYARSSLRKVSPETGDVTQMKRLAPNFFGEGITIWGDKIIQLTWKSQKGFVYDKDSFDLLQEFSYPTEGWGITHDDTRLIMSDGSANLYFWNPDTLAEIGRIEVTDKGTPVVRLNELEYINGEIYANIWQTNRVARIDPNTGQVTAWIDLSGLLTPDDLAEPVDVLNGIAYDAETDRLFVTGKLWNKIFEIELVPKN